MIRNESRCLIGFSQCFVSSVIPILDFRMIKKIIIGPVSVPNPWRCWYWNHWEWKIGRWQIIEVTLFLETWRKLVFRKSGGAMLPNAHLVFTKTNCKNRNSGSIPKVTNLVHRRLEFFFLPDENNSLYFGTYVRVSGSISFFELSIYCSLGT